VDIATINPYRQWALRFWELFPVAWTPLNEHGAFLPEPMLDAFGNLLDVSKHGRHVEILAQW
jgi:hypothetical protein